MMRPEGADDACTRAPKAHAGAEWAWMKQENLDIHLYQKLQTLMQEDGLVLDATMERLMARHLEVLRAWQPVASLVSKRDLADLWTRHVADSLSLTLLVRRFASGGLGTLLDIGSGGGFPALPVKVVLPGLRVCLVERSERKVGFLCKLVRTLGLSDVSVVHGEFPVAAAGVVAEVMTARAVERPTRLLTAFTERIAAGTVFLCQNEATAEQLAGRFHVEQVLDGWTAAGLRRGGLWVVRQS